MKEKKASKKKKKKHDNKKGRKKGNWDICIHATNVLTRNLSVEVDYHETCVSNVIKMIHICLSITIFTNTDDMLCSLMLVQGVCTFQL